MYTGKKQSRFGFLPALVFILSCAFLALLLSTIQHDVFFSGDGGLKYLIARQTNTPANYTSLPLQADPWISNIWKQGFYPFKAPFVYDSPGKKTVSFPPFFQQLSAPFYHIWGYAGLYAIPFTSIVLLWSWFIRLLVLRRVKPVIIAFSLFCLSFCTPLTLYAATYWEHTLAVLLLFGGIVFLVNPAVKPLGAIALGFLAGLSAWLRPEALLLCLLITAMVVYNHSRHRNRASPYFVISLFAVLVLFFLYNQVLYGNLLGVHSYQVFNDTSTMQKLHQSLILLVHLNAKQIIFFPLSLLFFAAIIYALVKKAVVPAEVVQLFVITILFSLVAPFFLPNAGGKQWGPRYFLFLAPVVLVAAALFANSVSLTNVLSKTWLWLIVPVIAYSVYLNGYMAFTTLHDDYAYRVKPCLQFVQHDPCKVVVVQNQFIAQEFAALFQTKNIFLAENQHQYASLQTLLKTAHINEAIFISRDKDLLLPCNLHKAGEDNVQHMGDYYFTRCIFTPYK